MTDAVIITTRKRHQLLQNSDWTELPSNQARHSEAWRQAWSAYREALRAVDVQDPVWPTPPHQDLR